MALSTACSALVSFLQKRLFLHSPGVSPFEVVLWISWLMAAAYYLAMRSQGQSPFNVPPKHRGTLLFRAVVGITSNALQVASLKLIALTKSSVIYFTFPIFTGLFAHWHLGERLSPYDWVACFMAFLGILIIQNPFAAGKGDTFQETLGTACAFLGAVTAGMTFVSIKKMGREVYHVMSPFAWALANLMLCPLFTLGQRFATGTITYSYSLYDILFIIAIAGFQLLNMTFATLAY